MLSGLESVYTPTYSFYTSRGRSNFCRQRVKPKWNFSGLSIKSALERQAAIYAILWWWYTNLRRRKDSKLAGAVRRMWQYSLVVSYSLHWKPSCSGLQTAVMACKMLCNYTKTHTPPPLISAVATNIDLTHWSWPSQTNYRLLYCSWASLRRPHQCKQGSCACLSAEWVPLSCFRGTLFVQSGYAFMEVCIEGEPVGRLLFEVIGLPCRLNSKYNYTPLSLWTHLLCNHHSCSTTCAQKHVPISYPCVPERGVSQTREQSSPMKTAFSTEWFLAGGSREEVRACGVCVYVLCGFDVSWMFTSRYCV